MVCHVQQNIYRHLQIFRQFTSNPPYMTSSVLSSFQITKILKTSLTYMTYVNNVTYIIYVFKKTIYRLINCSKIVQSLDQTSWLYACTLMHLCHYRCSKSSMYLVNYQITRGNVHINCRLYVVMLARLAASFLMVHRPCVCLCILMMRSMDLLLVTMMYVKLSGLVQITACLTL